MTAYVAKEAFAPDATWTKDEPSEPGGYEHGTPVVAEVCGRVELGSGFKVMRTRRWSGQTMAVRQHVHALSEQKAADLVEQVRAKSRTCTTFTAIEGKPQRAVTPDAEVPRPDGLDDFYAYCGTLPDLRPGMHTCEAYLAWGDLLVVAGANAAHGDPAEARRSALEQLKAVAPGVALALGRA
ncbi:hypothetical protein SAMN05216188_103159 [Lentzea xinjiangensis]|uniref:Uncharacterized protein n=1 Tax=Lentzea xinjiangensis TaxID=402600 RepID=A0A1H9GC66_9PSEU|nr:hypothetical protein [Lentzea xinjiangensis]SEQ47692.1 hypothetical protein SAMN05216188_103159 [Lentzea xinjiangensis]